MAPLYYNEWLVLLVMDITDYDKMKQSYKTLCGIANREINLIIDQIYKDMENKKVESLDSFDLLMFSLNISSLSKLLDNIIDYRGWLRTHETE